MQVTPSPAPVIPRRAVASWILYDLANTICSRGVVSLYFSLLVRDDVGASRADTIYGLISAPDVPPYHASKGAVRLMTKTDALFYAAERIRVNSIHPGFIWTPMVEGFLREQGDLEAGRRAVGEAHPLGHVGEPDDIAWGCVYLASDEAKFVTGAELVIDGGYTAR